MNVVETARHRAEGKIEEALQEENEKQRRRKWRKEEQKFFLGRRGKSEVVRII
ncbi:Protein CBG25362 [Caenorhabditis briggsae]|uniref:Protein CBG25362 n=1 Tax=Caenorhabditis briggsae TaxID=6238 RepID=B6IIM6_CAEBR|nr:Protein CBG25362 [Caenorhabditis briggsae]CAR99756.1 Protein CBG25362 [Caenorhabditis briggsae]